MYQHGTISKTDYEKAKAEKIEDPEIYKVEGAHHFADMVYQEVNEYIGERDTDIYVSTTLDQELQQTSEKILQDTIKANLKNNVTQGAVVILDYQGAVKALVGGANYTKNQFHTGVQLPHLAFFLLFCSNTERSNSCSPSQWWSSWPSSCRTRSYTLFPARSSFEDSATPYS